MPALFGEGLTDMLRLLAEYEGDNAYAVRAKRNAKAWLAEVTLQNELQ